MPVVITDPEPTVYLTAEEERRLRGEYAKSFMHYCGTPPSFAAWVKARQRAGAA